MFYSVISLVFFLLGVTWLNWESVRTRKTTLIRLWLSSLVNMFRLTLTVVLLRLLYVWTSFILYNLFFFTYKIFHGVDIEEHRIQSYLDYLISYMGHTPMAKEILMDETLSLEDITRLVYYADLEWFYPASTFFIPLYCVWTEIACILLYIIKYGPNLDISKLSVLRRSRPLFFYLCLVLTLLPILVCIYTFWGLPFFVLIKLFPVKILVVTAICNCLSFFWLNCKLILYFQTCNSLKEYSILAVSCILHLFSVYSFSFEFSQIYGIFFLPYWVTPAGCYNACYELYFYTLFLGMAFWKSDCSSDDIEVGKKSTHPSMLSRTFSAPACLETTPWSLSDPVRGSASVQDECVEENKEDSLNFPSIPLRSLLDPELLKDLDSEYLLGLEKGEKEYVPYFPTPWEESKNLWEELHAKASKAFSEMRNRDPLYFKKVRDLENYRLSLENKIEFSKEEITRCIRVRDRLSGNMVNTVLGRVGDVFSNGGIGAQGIGQISGLAQSGYTAGELEKLGCMQTHHAGHVSTVRTCEAETAVVDAVIRMKKAEPGYIISSAISKFWARLWG